jgi:murein L,D-transpeptidase YafK
MRRFAKPLLLLVALLAVGLIILTQRPPKPPPPLPERLTAAGLRPGLPVFIRIIKESSELEVWMRGGSAWLLLHTYPICRWSGRLGPKLREGDGQAPEGFYVVTAKALNPKSAYHLSFNLGYPNAYDRAHGRTGSFLMVHGDCRSVGCYAMTDAGIEQIYGLVAAALAAGQTGIPVHIFPFRMTAANMDRHLGKGWNQPGRSLHTANAAAPTTSLGDYWTNLKEGWDHFQITGQPPTVFACQSLYKFGNQSNTACVPVSGL